MKNKTSFGGNARRGRPAPQGSKPASKPFGRSSGQRHREDSREDERKVRRDDRRDDQREEKYVPEFKRVRGQESRGTERSFSSDKRKPYPKRDRQGADSRRDDTRRGEVRRDKPWYNEAQGDKRQDRGPKAGYAKPAYDKPRRDDARRDDRRDRGPKTDYTKPSYDKLPYDKPRREDGRRDGFRRDENRRDDRRDRGPKAGYAKSRFDTPRNDKPRRENLRRDPVRRDEPRREEYKSEGHLIWGLHAVRAAWLNPQRRCFRLWLTEAGRTSMEKVLAEGSEALLKRPDAKLVERQELDRLTPPGTVHQGILLDVSPLPEPALGDLIAGDAPPEVLLMLDQVTDPHNVGAIMRSAAAFGAGGVIMTERNAPGTTGVLAKSASGALEHVPQLHVVNLSRALDELQQAGYWCVGLAEEGTRDLSELDLTGRTVLVMGAEGEGLRQLTRKKCNELARLPTGGAIGSLNVSNAAAVALYEWKRQKSKNRQS